MADDDLPVSIAHLLLAFVSGHDLSRWHVGTFSHPGVHCNFFINGILGFIHYQKNILNVDVTEAFKISTKATKYLALPCLMADLYKQDTLVSMLHLASGVIPFSLVITQNEDENLSNLVIAGNALSLCYYSHMRGRQWGWYTAAAALITYFLGPKVEHKLFYPLGLSVVSYCAYRVFRVHLSH